MFKNTFTLQCFMTISIGVLLHNFVITFNCNARNTYDKLILGQNLIYFGVLNRMMGSCFHVIMHNIISHISYESIIFNG